MICTGQGGAPCYAGRLDLTARGVESSGVQAGDGRVKGLITNLTFLNGSGLQSTTLHARHMLIRFSSLVLHDAVPIGRAFISLVLHDAVPIECALLVSGGEI